MDLSIKTDSLVAADQSWLGSSAGVRTGRPVTFDMTTFTSGTHYPDGFLKSGLALGKITASGKYGPYDDAAADGRQTCVGFLLDAPKAPASTATPIQGSLLDGTGNPRVILAKLPVALDANGQADLAGKFILI